MEQFHFHRVERKMHVETATGICLKYLRAGNCASPTPGIWRVIHMLGQAALQMTKQQQGIKVIVIDCYHTCIYVWSAQWWGINEPQHSDAEQMKRVMNWLYDCSPVRYRNDMPLDLPFEWCQEKIAFHFAVSLFSMVAVIDYQTQWL